MELARRQPEKAQHVARILVEDNYSNEDLKDANNARKNYQVVLFT